jgi:probable phosphoglycerate mutase
MRLPGFGLSDWGKKQAAQLAKIFAARPVKAIYASPLKRTKETAEICADGKLRVHYSKDLIEANFKKWEGLLKSDRDPTEVAGYFRDPVKYSAMLGESLVDIQKRVVGKIVDLIHEHRGEEIIVVTHAAPSITARLYFEQRPLDEYQRCLVAFASVTTIIFNDDLKCTKVEYHEYVKQRGLNER